MKARDLFLIAATLLAAAPARAQLRQRTEEVREIRRVGGPDGDRTVHFAWTADAFEGKDPVKNAPYSATAVTEVEQTLGDGNRIQQKTRSLLARDREGRTRKELALNAVGPLAVGGPAPRMVFLQDPVAGTNYHLEPEQKIARKMPRPTELGPHGLIEKAEKGKRIEHRSEEVFTVAVPPPPGEGMGLPPVPMVKALGNVGMLMKGMPAPKTEDLGTQVMEGVRAQGTRSTTTIPAGAIGNERPIVTTSERWFSPELNVVVMSKHSDPRLGTTTYRLTDLVRNDPDPSLFQVPSDYTVKEAPGRVILRRRQVLPK